MTKNPPYIDLKVTITSIPLKFDNFSSLVRFCFPIFCVLFYFIGVVFSCSTSDSSYKEATKWSLSIAGKSLNTVRANIRYF